MRKLNFGTMSRIVISGTAVFCLAAIIFISYRLEDANVQERLQARVTSIAAIAAHYAAYTIVKGDDLALVELMKEMVTQPGITKAMVVSNNGLVVAHSQPSEIGSVANQARVAGEFIHPLTNLEAPGYILKIVSQPALETAQNKHSVINLVTFAVVISIITGGLAFSLTQRQNKKINQWVVILRQLLPADRVKSKQNELEFGNWAQLTWLFNQLSVAAASGVLGAPAEEKRLKDINAVLSGIGKTLEQPVIMLDTANRIVFANTGGKELMLNDNPDPAGAYFPEVCRNAELVECVKSASQGHNAPVNLNLKSLGKTVKINFLENETNKRLGVIIVGV